MRLRFLIPVVLLWAAPALAGSGRVDQRRGETRTEVRQLLQGGSPQSALARLHYLGEERYAASLLAQAFDELTRDERRRDVALVLAGLGQPSSESLFLEWLDSKDGALRMSGARGLGRIRSRRMAAVVPLLQDPSLGVRREAAKALGEAHDRRFAKPLLEAAKTEGEPEVRSELLVAVGQSGSRASVKPLLVFLDSTSESTRFAAARALCLLGHERGFAFAKKLLSSSDRFERRQAVTLFEGLPAKKAAPYLEPALNDKDRHVAAKAARVLYDGGDGTKLEWLVLASYLSKGDDKLAIEAELETLRLTDAQRAKILKKAGVE